MQLIWACKWTPASIGKTSYFWHYWTATRTRAKSSLEIALWCMQVLHRLLSLEYHWQFVCIYARHDNAMKLSDRRAQDWPFVSDLSCWRVSLWHMTVHPGNIKSQWPCLPLVWFTLTSPNSYNIRLWYDLSILVTLSSGPEVLPHVQNMQVGRQHVQQSILAWESS